MSVLLAMAAKADSSPAAAVGAAAISDAIADANEAAAGPMPQVRPKAFIKPQCQQWFNMLVDLYNSNQKKVVWEFTGTFFQFWDCYLLVE